ncbi:uncharacterized protein LOC128558051 [Mercenaria mercenaria]|uniref:uncharacterized protein LOC128558051 n=1 Tax=Mercenaria mercenaria TaxID=6596 RepID=UPI00234E4B52|nr:uncharacterized protein LOC128558051 [Mercenaria mercenaria]
MSSTATDQLEVMTGTLPISLHLKCKNAEELIRFYSKVEENPIKQDLQAWMTDRAKTNKCMYKHLISHFNEVKGKTELEHVETDFKCSKEGGLALCRKVSYIKNEEENQNKKDQQVENITEIISKLTDREISMFTDGSTLGNPGPTGTGACIYFKGTNSDPVQLKCPVSPNSNNYVGELNGIRLALSFLEEKNIQQKSIHLFVDCQPAIKTIFSNTIPALTIETRQILQNLENKNNKIQIQWTPGHKNIEGNEIADKLAKEAASEMIGKQVEENSRKVDKKELTKDLRLNAGQKWQRRYENTEGNERFMEIFPTVQPRKLYKSERRLECIINQKITGHSHLNSHMSKILHDVQEICPNCDKVETTRHFIFECPAYATQRNKLEREAEEASNRHSEPVADINLKVLIGNSPYQLFHVEGRREFGTEIQKLFQQFIKDTRRFK